MAANLPSASFKYVRSCDYKKPVQIKIGTLEGEREKPSQEEIHNNPILNFSGRNRNFSDLWVECLVVNSAKDKGDLTVRTAYKPFTSRWNWNEWLELPIRFHFLHKETTLLLTIYDSDGPGNLVPVGGTSVKFFTEEGVFQKGRIDLKVWPGIKAHFSNTPGQNFQTDNSNDQMHRLIKLAKEHDSKQLVQCEWMDQLAFREIEIINRNERRISPFMYLMIEFPNIMHKGEVIDLIHWDPGIDEYNEFEKKKKLPIYDPDIGLENLFERKHHYLTRNARSGLNDKEQKPNSAIRDKLYKVMEYPPTKQLTSEEHDLMWKFRFYLSTHKKALTKFLKGVNWELEGPQAIDMLKKWAPLDPQDALELLGSTFTCPDVRYYAVERLSFASDEELLLYLLQLVQALRYEPFDSNSTNLLDMSHYSLGSDSSSNDAGAFPSNNPSLTRTKERHVDSKEASSLESSYSSSNSEDQTLHTSASNTTKEPEGQTSLLEAANENSPLDLATFLIKRASQNPILANYLYWYLHVECEDKTRDEQGMKQESKVREIYLHVMRSFKVALQQGTPKSRSTWQILNRQQHFLDKLVVIVKSINKESGGRPKKIEKLQSLVSNPEFTGGFSMTNFEPLPLPLDPTVNVVGLIPEKATLFKSTQEPSRLTFKTSTGAEYVTIFKYGDDLRQDQLIIGMIMLIDTLLQNENLDLKLTPYRVLATSYNHGFMQYVDSVAIADINRTEGSIYAYLRKIAPCDSSPLGISKHVMDNYIKSLAGYSVITYLLGIGDRHFDNLLLTKEGNLFHVDFGYILGRDPKPLPPPIKLTKEMVEVMGGQSSVQYKEFRKLCCAAFHQLRRHANLILNLFSLLVDASVRDIMLEPDKMVKKVEDRFCLSLSDEEAASHMQEIIDSSLSAVVAVVVENFHRFAQYMRK